MSAVATVYQAYSPKVPVQLPDPIRPDAKGLKISRLGRCHRLSSAFWCIWYLALKSDKLHFVRISPKC